MNNANNVLEIDAKTAEYIATPAVIAVLAGDLSLAEAYEYLRNPAPKYVNMVRIAAGNGWDLDLLEGNLPTELDKDDDRVICSAFENSINSMLLKLIEDEGPDDWKIELGQELGLSI